MKQITNEVASLGRLVGFVAVLGLLVTAGCGLATSNEDRLDRAQNAYLNGEYRAAIIDTKNVLLDEPDNMRAREILGRASVEIGDGQSAEKELRMAIEMGADRNSVIVDLGRALLLQAKFGDVLSEVRTDEILDPSVRATALRVRGDALIGIGEPEQARDSFRQALQLDDRDVEAQLGVVRTYIVERNYLQARETLNQVLGFDDSYIPAWLASGALALSMRDTSRAASDYGRAADLARNAGDAVLEMSALMGTSEALFVQGEVDPARPLLARMQEIAAKDTRTLLVTAQLAIADEDWTRAQENLLEITRRNPQESHARTLLGIVHKERGNLGQAEMYLAAVVSADPSNANARRQLAEVRLQLNKTEEARQTLQSIIEGPNADSGALSLSANANMLLGEIDEAERLLQRAVAEDPNNFALKLQLAIAYLRSSKLQAAQDLLESATVPEGSDNEFQREQLLVITRMVDGDNAGALETARDLVKRWPGRLEPLSLVGSIMMSSGDFAGAREYYTRALEIEPENISILRNLARLDFAQDDLEAASDRFRLILELQPSDVRSMIALARLAGLGERYEAATTWLEKARETDERALWPRLVLAAIYGQTGSFDDAEEVAGEAVHFAPDDPAGHGVLGQIYLAQKKYRPAEQAFNRASQLDPENPEHVLNAAKAMALSGDRKSAVGALEADLERSLRHLPSAMALASLKADGGDIVGAETIVRGLRLEFPGEAAVPALQAELAAKRGDFATASEFYDTALAIERTSRHSIRAYQMRFQSGHSSPLGPILDFIEERPFDNGMRIYLAGAYMRVDDIVNANVQYEIILSQDPANVIAANNLAYNYLRVGDKRAEEMARRAYEIQPQNAVVMDTLGWILVNKGNLDEGISMLRGALQAADNNPDIGFHLATGLVAAGEQAEARKMLESILSGDSKFASRQDAERLLGTL